MGKKIKIALFCGGRGCASIIRALLRVPEVDLSLLVNAYDNGASTGEMRRYIPGYLGPSDFRKNLSYLLELHSPQQYTLAKLLDYRLASDFDGEALKNLIFPSQSFQAIGKDFNLLANLLQNLNLELQSNIYAFLKCFLDYYMENKEKTFNFSDCSFGNIIFAGAFLKNNRNFEKAIIELMPAFQSKINANLINVTAGENRFLVVMKEDGEILEDEAKIVAAQSNKNICNIYLLPEQLRSDELSYLSGLDFEDKKKFLEGLNREVKLSGTAKQVLESCDIIIYGPGTQFSSLIPSYKTEGIREAIESSNAKIKVFVVNIIKDHDIESYSAEDIIDNALKYLGDEKNEGGNLITHALYNKGSNYQNAGVKLLNDTLLNNGKYKNILFSSADYEHPVYPGIHSGDKTVKTLLSLYENEKYEEIDELDVYMDLNERSIGVRLTIDEFIEIDWLKHFKAVNLFINNVDIPKIDSPNNIRISSTKNQGYFSENEVFKKWFFDKKTNYLVTITGDGEYRMNDILYSINVLHGSIFGAVYGSRNQSRQQFIRSINAAYGESKYVFFLSRLGAIFIGIIFALRFKRFFSDPLTGFRVYNRRVLRDGLINFYPAVKLKTSVTLTHYITKNKIDIAEIPVRYRTYKGFTNMKWRLLRGMRNLLDIIL